ncbi:hypothetical protein K504DRAFT_506705 [Pleomassaria siparia CBS 279.74]|uniref:Zn(2)-C6 fungal-type domain-containing protein n=1 Tax=Pleomassaria siparia CBS 279.74 TaxID=1314801 RepID=A0A6G1JWV4_9PLEO|nr:hypothetical protein K504DRAFT_506705 [Pleomassaria siparia CBS 279.74]
MSAVRNARPSRKGEIPGTLTLKWQNSSTPSAKPLSRRPLTACQSCRAAKAKCDGQRECHNCSIRRLKCTYTTTAVSPPTNQQTSSECMSTISTLDVENITPQTPMDTVAHDHSLSSIMTADFDWRATGPSIDDWDLHTYPPPSWLDISQSSTVMLSLPSQPFPILNCQCRETLAAFVPQINTAMQEHQLDQVVKVTQRVVDNCQEVVDCTHCQIGCTDLICTTAVLQQTDVCFEYMAKAELESPMTVNFGGRDMSINNPRLRAMLVTNLIQQASSVLDAISAKAQSMLQRLAPPTALAEANCKHLETVISDMRTVLQRATGYTNECSST